MSRPPAFPITCAWGAACGAALGAFRTREACLHLLAKGRALEAAGVPSLPGPSHWGVLASWQPVGAGALFFGLSLGLGWGALAALWVSATRGLPSAGRTVRAAAAAAPSAWAAAGGDWALAAALLAIGAGALTLDPGTRGPTPRRALLAAACFGVSSLGLLPWLLASEGGFTRLRDRWLLPTEAGLRLDEFYYRWTLYPAEALKPLDSVSQPTVQVSALAPARAAAFCAESRPLRVLCVAGLGPGSDAVARPGPGGVELTARARTVPWPAEVSAQREAWARLAREADFSARLRGATGQALFVGCPLGLAWAVGAACLWLAELLAPRRVGVLALGLAASLAAGLAASGFRSSDAERSVVRWQPDSLADARRALASPSPVERFYAGRAAAAFGPEAAVLLDSALSDPVVNVRYAAAEGLGAAGDPAAIPRLLALLGSREEWYVKERAYGALWRLGWRPETP